MGQENYSGNICVLFLLVRAIPWKEKLVFFFIWSGNIFAKWKKNSLDKEGMKMAKIYMYAHGGSGNHGCEAIVRSTCDMLNNPLWDEILLISSKTEEDIKYGLDKICTIKKDVQSYSKITLPFIRAYIALKLKNDYVPLDKLNYKKTIDMVHKNDIVLSIGGDNYCYADVNKYIMLHNMMISRGAKTVLWGCSINPEVLSNPEIVNDVRQYQLITARESITYNALKKIIPIPYLLQILHLDSKQHMQKFHLSLSIKNMVGINLSPMVQKEEKISGIIMKNYEILIEHILKETDMAIALIPHVIWDDSDDRIPLMQLYERYKKSGRVLVIEDQNCSKLKYAISKCRFFVGARTHSTIAAYSSGIPTLVVGYSVKARGIARDLFGTEDKYVIPAQSLSNTGQLQEAFRWIRMHEQDIRSQLMQRQAEYKEYQNAYAEDLRR